MNLRVEELKQKNQVVLPVWYKGITMEQGYKIDILVEEEFVIELKAVETILPIHKAQLITYLKLSEKRIGFLINFNVPLLKDGFQRIIKGFDKN